MHPNYKSHQAEFPGPNEL
ncbi:hypothetical protein YPPY14_3497, partial [Yersinia pestis PY-14]